MIFPHVSKDTEHGMTRWSLVQAGILSLALGTTALAQNYDPSIQRSSRKIPARALESRTERISPLLPSDADAKPLTPLELRGGAVPTGLGGFYDYQSNGGSPGYLYIRAGEWDRIYTTFMNSLQGGNEDEISASRRVGYAYSSNGGSSWISNRAIQETRLGFPSLTVTSEGLPVIAAHGDLGTGDQSILYMTPGATELSSFFMVSQLPQAAASGKENGVIWPQVVMAKDEATAVVLGSYNNNLEGKEPYAPLQLVTMDINSGEVPAHWGLLTDSATSVTSGGRTAIARSSSGKLAAAWYRLPLDSNDNENGIYISESTDDGATWSTATPVLVGEISISDFNINGDVDTLSAGTNLDLAYLGDEPQLVFTGNMNGFLQFGNILYWSPSKNLKMITLSHQVPGLGAYGIPLDHRQSNMGSLAYPTISVGDDGQHVVVAFSAVSQTLNEAGDAYTSVISELDYLYYRVWGVGSPDGGQNWGRPFIIQDFAGAESDSASIEYPVASEVGRMVDGSFELPLTFMARRYPGMYTGMQDGEIAGPITETLQYFQRFTVTPTMFTNVSATPSTPITVAERFSVRVVPNVTAGSTEVVATLPSSGRVDVRLYTLLGEQVYATSRAGQTGIERIPLDLRDVPAGTYRCAIYQNGYTTSAQIVVAR
jgi:hypothetical protein